MAGLCPGARSEVNPSVTWMSKYWWNKQVQFKVISQTSMKACNSNCLIAQSSHPLNMLLQLEELCRKAMAGGADRKIQTQIGSAFTFVSNVGVNGSNAPGGNEYPVSFLPGTHTFLPTSVAVNGYETWEFYNNITQSAGE